MENLKNHVNEVTPVTTENDTNDQSSTLITRKVEKVKSFRDYAYEQAGLNKGESFSLKVYLQWIKEGHIVDDTYNENDQNLLKKQVLYL